MATGGQTNAVAGSISSANTNALFGTSTNNLPGGFTSEPTPEELALETGIVRNISFSGIRATVTKPFPLPESEHPSGYNPAEVFSCIGLNAVGAGWLENISFDDIHITFPGGGTAARRNRRRWATCRKPSASITPQEFFPRGQSTRA